MKIIPLRPFDRGMFTIVDDEDFEYLNQFRWFHSKSVTNAYTGYAFTNLKFTDGVAFTAGIHRLILGDIEPYEGWATENGVRRYTMPNGLILLKGGNKSGGIKRITVDHIDGDGLNNVRSNLRHANASTQVSNRCRCELLGRYYRRCTCRKPSLSA